MVNLDNAIRKIPDFPKPGVLFYDITSIFTDPRAFSHVIDTACDLYALEKPDVLMAVESRGFIFAAAIAYNLKKPFILARKKGKLPGDTVEQSYSLEYGEATLEIQKSDLKPHSKVLIIDDLIATGGTLEACAKLVEKVGCTVEGFFGVIGLPFLKYEERLKNYRIDTMINYDCE